MRLKQIGSAGNKTRRYHERPNETSNTEVKETMKVAITAKRVVILMMTMALAVAMVACQGAAGTPGKDAETPKLAPFKVGTIPAMALVVGDAGTVDLSGYFSDPEGRALTYTAVSSMTKYATVAPPEAAMLTVTPVAAGTSTITVTATDPDKLKAMQTFMVTVTAATTTPPITTPPTTPTDGPVKVGTIPAVSLVAGTSEDTTLDVSKLFTDASVPAQALTYTVASSAMTIATAALDSATAPTKVTITGVAAGSAMVTLTATDPDMNMANHVIAVTVTAATTPTKPSALTVSKATELDIAPFLTASQKAANYEVVSSNGSIFTAALKMGSVWTLTPKSHGAANATIQNKNTASEVGSVAITVPNRAPILDPKAPTAATVVLMKIPTPPANGVGSGDNTNKPTVKTGLGTDLLQVYHARVVVANQFKDPDTVDVLTYAFTPSRSDVKISNGASCKTSPCALEIDVLTKAAASYFELKVVASDPGGLMSSELVIPVDSNDPLEQTYETGQLDDRFRPITVGYRESKHTLQFGAYADGVFKFVDAHIEKLVADTALAGATIQASGSVLLGKPSDLEVQDQDGVDADVLDEPGHMIHVESSGTVKHGRLTDSMVTPVPLTSIALLAGDFLDSTTATDDPQLEFTLVGSSGSGTITLTHYVWVSGTTSTTDKDRWVKSAPVSLTVTVEPVK